MKKMVTLAVKLFVITAIATAALAFVNGKTAPVISERETREYAESLKNVYEEADEFESLADKNEAKLNKIKEKNEAIEDIVYAKSGGEDIGYVFKVNGKGYGGPITFVIGVDKESNILGYQVLVTSETKGFGSQVQEEPFISSVVGKKIDNEVKAVADPSGDNEIQAISGTTLSVNGILKGLNGAVKALAELEL